MDKKFIDMLSSGERVLGAFSTLNSANAAECLGLSGLDFIIIDTEHGPGDVESTLHAITASELRGTAPFVRVKDVSRSSVLKMLDIGAAGLIVPYISCIDEVKKLVEYGKYAPLGSRGYGLVRSGLHGTIEMSVEEYFQYSNRNSLLIPQCETMGCLNDIDAIAGLEGVDGIFVGPYDLSVALGIPGQMLEDKLLKAIERVLMACRQAQKYAFIFAGDYTAAQRYFDMGFGAVACGTDSSILLNAAKAMIKQIKA